METKAKFDDGDIAVSASKVPLMTVSLIIHCPCPCYIFYYCLLLSSTK
uniref:Uncharacterized protein n=1 Tax=Rhizophora mucronata TaxID=61149 RepID=A0A2P2N7F3_RHIMU